MALHASWVHGTALAVENPENLTRASYFGWGAEMHFVPGKSGWFHMPLPTPVIVGDVRTKVQKLFLMFKTDAGEIRNVHIWDGPNRIQTFDGLHLTGDHWNGLDAVNTFNLSTPHSVIWGMGISFFVQASIGFDTVIDPKLFVASAGGDFTV
jgi:hypothetical protein